jgi:hypothetical protein
MATLMRILMALGLAAGLGATAAPAQEPSLERQQLKLELAQIEVAEVPMLEEELDFELEELAYDELFFASASCPYLGEDFEGSLTGWSFANVSRQLLNGALNLINTTSGLLGRAEHDFDPAGYFTLDMEVTEQRNTSFLGFQPFHDGGPVLSMGSYRFDGLGVVLLADGRVGLLGFDWNSIRWIALNPRDYGTVTKIGVGYYKKKLTLRINGKNKEKIKANFSQVPDLDRLWLIVAGLNTQASFDNLCAKKRK